MANVIQATIADIQALTNATRQSDTYYSTDSEKQGTWQRSAPDSGITANNGTIIKDQDQNIWTRVIYNNEYNSEWFKLATDTDDTNAINAAVVAAKSKTVVLKKGKTYTVSSVTIANAVKITGGGKLVKRADIVTSNPLLYSATDAPVLFIAQSTKDVIIDSVEIDGSRSKIATITSAGNSSKYRGIYAETSVPSVASRIVERITINNVTIKNTFNEAIKGQWCSNVTVTNCKIENCEQASTVIGGTAQVNAAIYFSYPTLNTEDYIWEYDNIVVSNCDIDQRLANNGCVKIATQGANQQFRASVLKTVRLSANNCQMADYTPAAGIDTDYVSIIGFECVTNSNGAMVDLIINDNTIVGTPIPEPDPGITGWAGPVTHLFGISLGGNSGIVETVNGYNGLEDVLINNNIIKSCRRYSVEIAGKNVTVSNNDLDDAGIISVNANSILGGMTDIKIIGNTMKANPGYREGYKPSFSVMWVKAENKSLDGLLVEGNIFETHNNFYTTWAEDPDPAKPLIKTSTEITNFDADMIFIQSSATTGIKNVSFINNHFKRIVKTAIALQNTVYAQAINISGNIFEWYINRTDPGPGTFPFYAISSDAASMDELSINNNIFNCLVTAKNGNAIKLTQASASKQIVSNNIIKNPSIGIRIGSGSDYLILTENIITDYTQSYLMPNPLPTNKVIVNNLPQP